MKTSNRTFAIRWVAALLLLAVAALPLASVRAQGTPTLKVVSPSNGAKITSADITVQTQISNLNVDCAQMGRPDQAGSGEILVFIDGATVAQLANFYCTDTFTIPGDGLTPGQHKLTIVLASNTYVPMMDTAQAIKIDFEPAQPLPLPVADNRGAPAVKLASLIDGSTVPMSFPVQVQAINFTATVALEGKADVVGYGHFHVWVDAPDKPTSLANLVLMPGTNAFTLDLSAWGPGKHTIRIEAAKNDHTKYDPSTPVTFTVNVSASAAPAASPAAASPAATTPPQGPATAAASPPAAGAAHGQASLELVDIAFKPSEFTIAANQNVVVTLKNTGATAHNFSVTDHNNPKVKNLNISVNVAPGATQTVTINAPAGDYYFFCNVPGHEAAGMHGIMHVK